MYRATTQLLFTRTTCLRTWLRHTDPYMLISAVIFALILLGSAGRTWLDQRAPATVAPIIIVATATPLRALGATQELRTFARMAAAPAAAPGAAVLAQSAPTAETPGYVAQTDQGAVFVPDDATPVPAGTSYTGPFLAPAAETPAQGQRLCTGFGDWRDYDPMYASSPVCHQP